MSKKQPKDKVLYLTFDDGPHAEYTEKLLDLLRRYNITASFFTVARFAEQCPDLIRRMQAEGHTIGYHSYEHSNALFHGLSYTSLDFIKSAAIYEKLSVKIKYFRPPWGCFNLVALNKCKKCGYSPVLWDLMVGDWMAEMTADIIVKQLLMRTKEGNIICLHDGRGKNQAPLRTIAALETVIPLWLDQGYRFAVVNELYE